MIISNVPNISSISNSVKAKVDIYLNSTLVQTCTCSDVLQDFSVSREGDNSKFFGFGICHKLKINIIDLYRILYLTKYHTIKIYLGDGENWDCPYPTFYVNEVSRDEDNNTITIDALDLLNNAATHTVTELNLVAPYTLVDVVNACASLLGVTTEIPQELEFNFNLDYTNGANFSGDETIRNVLDYIAEVTQTIYYINYKGNLIFKQLNRDGQPNLIVERADYYSMYTHTPRKLTSICSATELGDNIEASTGEEGVTQYIRENPFLTLRPDVATILDDALTQVGGTEIYQFSCDWDGNYLLEIGDKISLTQEDGTTINSYLLSDTVEYDGTYQQMSEWNYKDNDNETPSNPTTIGDKINQTFAKVDKVNREISLVASEVNDQNSKISSLQINTSSISASVKTVEENTQESLNNVNETIQSLSKEVNLKLDEDDVTIAVTKVLEEGVEKVVTSTKKYTFNDTGLNIASSDSEISTKITEDGMRVYRGSKEVLTADNTGVNAEDLHATTYLHIGKNCRFEDYNRTRTACYWIGEYTGG